MDKFINFLKARYIKYQLKACSKQASGMQKFISGMLSMFYSYLLALELEIKLPPFIDRINNFYLRVLIKIFYMPWATLKIIFRHELNLSQIGLIVTTRCSLNCKNCGDWIQYVKDRRDFELDDILSDIDSVARVADHIYNFDILGGEPLMRKDIAEIINRASGKANICNVRIITNGTIVPPDDVLAKMDKKKLFFRISNYGEHSIKLKELTEALDRHGIHYYSSKLTTWSDLGAPYLRSYTKEELRKNLLLCLKREATNLFDGALYPCANVHMGMLIGAVPDNPNDYVCIRNNNSPEECRQIRQRLRKMLTKVGYTACNYCSGCGPDLPPIPIAEQIPRDSYIDFRTGEIKKRH